MEEFPRFRVAGFSQFQQFKILLNVLGPEDDEIKKKNSKWRQSFNPHYNNYFNVIPQPVLI